MRGFEKNSFGTSITLVNNFEVRVAGPELLIANTYPLFNLFVDTGLYTGKYVNTDIERSGFLLSAGFEVGITLINFLTLGYRGAVPLCWREYGAIRL